MTIYPGRQILQNHDERSPSGTVGRDRRLQDNPWLRTALFLVLFAALFFLTTGMTGEDDFPHGEFDGDCSLCHTDEAWVPAVISPEFDHDEASGFTRRGAHLDLRCQACHKSLNFAEAPRECAGCHEDVHLGELGSDCGRCHNPESFIDHGSWLRAHNSTRMPLTGRHLTADCEECHLPQPQGRLKWVNLPVDCYACHREEYQGTSNPNHADSGFDTGCDQCHTTAAWFPAYFSHNSSGFPLTGGHAGLDCEDCHVGGNYENTPSDCYACHQDDYDRTDDPDHRAAGYSTDCTQCHTTSDWSGAVDHTSFPLTGGHGGLDCNDCHADGVYQGTPTDCFACHQDDYNREHAGSGFPTDCTQCHSTSDWEGATDHSAFPLTGAHGTLDCDACHGDGVYEGTPTDCYACHRDDYDNTDDPDHQAAGYPTDCTQCHSTSNWDAEDAHTSFPLTGGHGGLDCNDCHANGVYQGTPTDCYACHQDDYNEEHAGSGFPTDCTQCHTTANWEGATDHSAFPLTGAHGTLDCDACHANGVYEGTPTDCWSCHQDDYNGEHAGSGFSHDCTECHSTSNWDADLDHTSWPLTGAHAAVDCSLCHIDGVYEGTPTDCWSCHSSEYNQEHSGSGFPHDCSICHSTTNWDAEDAHTSWPLTGGHGGLDCNDCHAGGVYEGTPTDCWSCHEDDYNDEHAGSGFPHDCTECHSTTDWDADFAHTSWALNGAHASVACNDCHENGVYEGTPTDCYDCHTSDFTGEHGGDGYPHDCLLCHDENNWDSDYDHNSFWPLTGAHRFANCTECHIGGVYAGTPTLCYDCHREEYEDEHSSSTPRQCEECHSTSDWDDDSPRTAIADHDALFPIRSGRHRNLWFSCQDCHPNKKNPAVFTCAGCHSPGDHPASGLKKASPAPSVFRRADRDCLVCHPRGD